MRAHERRRRSAPLNCAHPQQPCPSLCPKIHLNAVAVGELAVATARIVRVEEIVVVVLVRLPLAEGEANREGDSEEHEAERVIVDAEGLRGAMCEEGGDERRGWWWDRRDSRVPVARSRCWPEPRPQQPCR